MNKANLIEVVAFDADITKAQAARAVEAMIASITFAARAEGARIQGLGTFTSKRREASEGRNPRTGEKIQIAAVTLAKFSPARAFKERLNG